LMGSINRWLLARILRHGSASPDAWPDRRVDAVWDQFDQGTQRAILRLVRSAAAPPKTSGRVPALIVWGERDPWYPPALADAYAAHLPEARVARFPDAGHW